MTTIPCPHCHESITLLTVADAAEQLGIKERRMQVLIAQHGLGRRIGRDWVLTPADVERVRTRPSAGRPPIRTASD